MHYADRTDVLALALPRGGVPVAYEIALALHVPLDVFIGVGRWYEDFEQTTDEGVRLFLQDIRQQLLHA
jgi:predicted phosphoribosyltransferase